MPPKYLNDRIPVVPVSACVGDRILEVHGSDEGTEVKRVDIPVDTVQRETTEDGHAKVTIGSGPKETRAFYEFDDPGQWLYVAHPRDDITPAAHVFGVAS